MKKETLLKYCEEHKIFVPKDAGLDVINAAIVRAYYHRRSAKIPEGSECFGFWANEDATCMTCDFETKCFRASIGMDRKEYFKKLESAENPKFRFVEPRSKKKT